MSRFVDIEPVLKNLERGILDEKTDYFVKLVFNEFKTALNALPIVDAIKPEGCGHAIWDCRGTCRCSKCSSPINPRQNYCHECGVKIFR